MIPKRIAILGDSWAHGEWSVVSGRGTVTHPGLSHYLHQKWPELEIINFGTAGGRNLYQLDTLSEYNVADFDAVVVFWTDPGRDVINELDTNLNYRDLTIEKYEQKCQKYSNQNIVRLNDLGIPIALIGGHVSLPEIKEKYTNLYPVVDRMLNLAKHPFMCGESLTRIQGKVHNKIEWHALDRYGAGKLTEEFWYDVQQKMAGERWKLNLEFFNDLGHGNRHLHKLTSIKVIEQVEQW